MTAGRLDVETVNAEWQTVKFFEDVEQAKPLLSALVLQGIPAMLSCACGSYALGECEQCNEKRGEL